MKLPEGVKPVGHRAVYRPIEVSGRVRALAPPTPPGPPVVPGSLLDVLRSYLPSDWVEFYEESVSPNQAIYRRNQSWWDSILPGIKASQIMGSIRWADTKRGDAYWRRLRDDLEIRGL